MALIDDINNQLKDAMLQRDRFLTGVLRDLKSAFVYEEVAKGKKDTGLNDAEMEAVIAREVKKRDDAIEIYTAAGDKARSEKELAEREILAKFLPEPLSDYQLSEIIERVITTGGFGTGDMGRVIGSVKAEVGSRADGAKIAGLVKQLLK